MFTPVGVRTAAASGQQQPSSRGTPTPQQLSAGETPAAARHVYHRASSQAHKGGASGPLTGTTEGGSPAVASIRMRMQQAAGRKSVQFAASGLESGGRDVSGKRRRQSDQDVGRQALVQAPATVQKVRVAADQTGVAGTSGGATSGPSASVQKASGSKLQAKRAKSRPSFIEGF